MENLIKIRLQWILSDHFCGNVVSLNGKNEGLCIVYFDVGKIKYKGFYINGKEDGPWEEWRYINVGWKGSYENGEREGVWRCSVDNVDINHEIVFKNGVDIRERWVTDDWYDD